MIEQGDTAMADTAAVADSAGMMLLQPVEKPLAMYPFYEEGPFAGNPYFHLVNVHPHQGMVGEPVPYSVSRDNIVGTGIVCVFILGLLALSGSRWFMLQQFRNFFQASRWGGDIAVPVGSERLQYLLMLLVSLVLGLGTFVIGLHYGYVSTTPDTHWVSVGLLSIGFMVYFLFKGILYIVINWVFFDRKKNEQCWDTWLFVTTIEGILLFPLVLLTVYFNIPFDYALYYTLFVVVFVKMLVFYKHFCIFFQKAALCLQNILYFCALELTPIALLGGVVALISNNIYIKF